MKTIITYILIVSAFIANTYFILNLYIRDYSRDISRPIEKKLDSLEKNTARISADQAAIRRELGLLQDELKQHDNRSADILDRVRELESRLDEMGELNFGETGTMPTAREHGTSGSSESPPRIRNTRGSRSTVGKYERIIGADGKITYRRID